MITFAADYGYAGVSPATAINYLLDLYTEHYQTLVGQMSEKQRGVFMAIATEKIQIGERAISSASGRRAPPSARRFPR